MTVLLDLANITPVIIPRTVRTCCLLAALPLAFLLLPGCAHHEEVDDEFPAFACTREEEYTTTVETNDGLVALLEQRVRTPRDMLQVFEGPPDKEMQLPDGAVAYTYFMDRERRTRFGFDYNSQTTSEATVRTGDDFGGLDTVRTTVQGAAEQVASLKGGASTTEEVGCTTTFIFQPGKDVQVLAKGDSPVCKAPEERKATRTVATDDVSCAVEDAIDLPCSEVTVAVVEQECRILDNRGNPTGYTLSLDGRYTHKSSRCPRQATWQRGPQGWVYVSDTRYGVAGFVSTRCLSSE